MTHANFQALVDRIKTTHIYEDPSFWKSRGIKPTNIEVVILLREETNKFLDFLLDLHEQNLATDYLTELVEEGAEDLPWDAFNHDEREFFADVVSPVIQAMGVDAWLVL